MFNFTLFEPPSLTPMSLPIISIPFLLAGHNDLLSPLNPFISSTSFQVLCHTEIPSSLCACWSSCNCVPPSLQMHPIGNKNKRLDFSESSFWKLHSGRQVWHLSIDNLLDTITLALLVDFQWVTKVRLVCTNFRLTLEPVRGLCPFCCQRLK